MTEGRVSSPLPELDPTGFNTLKLCRSGPMLFNRFDIYIGGSLEKYGEFSVGEQDLFRGIVHRGELVVEVGANIGAHTVELARMVGPDGEVHAFEPQRIVFQTLCANLALNQLTNVRAAQAAVGAQAGTILVPDVNPARRANFGGVSLEHVEAGESVPLVTVDSLDLPACHFLKVDVEGMEADVVKGARQTIDTYRPLMYLENDRDEHSEELLGLVLGMDYAVYWHTPHLFNPANYAGDPENLFPGILSVNILCVPNETGIEVSALRRVVSATDGWRG